MAHIGLIGGIGPAATVYYYQLLSGFLADQKDSYDLTIVQADVNSLIANQAAGNHEAQAEMFAALSTRLKAAGADFVAVTSIAGHFCHAAFEALSPLPVHNMLANIADHLHQQGFKRIGILGTRIAMQSGFYGILSSIEIARLNDAMTEAVHKSYVAMAARGSVTQDERNIFYQAATALTQDQAADAVLLGGTDLVLAFDGVETEFPVVDCAKVHAESIARRAVG